MKSPFKFLDSYTKEDRDIFFGREHEIEELYRRVFDSKIMLVYGVSGTGKSSLIHCGLANKFQETDWLPLVIRRGSNVLDSMAAAIKSASITPQSAEIQTAPHFKKAVRSLYLDHYKPVYFIFDQFEELFIFGNREEDENFIKVLKYLLSADIQCKFIFILREEYLGWLSTFERSINGFFDNRMRVEKMDIGNAKKSIEGPCKIFNIAVEDGFAEKMLEKLCPPKESEIELTYLQVYLDKIFKLATEAKKDDGSYITFHISDLDKAGNVYDILGSFLDEQINNLPDPEQVMTVLKAFVSAKGTKRPANTAEVREYALATGKDIDETTINDLLISLVNLRILQDKDHTGRNELKHDALAAKIFEKITLVEKELIEIRQLIENAYHSWQKRGVLLSADDLQYIAPYESRLYLPEDYSSLVERSKKELVKARQRRRNIMTAAAVALIIILTGFTLWAVRERGKALVNEKIANEQKIKATSSEKEALIARDKAIESDTKAVASEKEAIKARDAAKESESRALYEKTVAEKRELQARANNFNFLAKEMVARDPTIALRLAEKALNLDPENKAILSNLYSIYYDNSFYRVFFEGKSDRICLVSPDWTKLITTNKCSGRLTDLKENYSHLLIGHFVKGFVLEYLLDLHNISRNGYDDILSIVFSPDEKAILTGSADKTARLWDLNGNTLQIFNGHFGSVNSAIFSPDGKTIFTGSSDGTSRLWDLNGKCLQIFRGHKDVVLSVAFSPDGKTVLTGSADSTAILWDLNGIIIQRFKGHSSPVLKVTFEPDGKKILTGSSDQTARLWDLLGNTLQVFYGHTQAVKTLTFSPDGNTILTGSSDKTARLWDLKGNTLQIFSGHPGSVNSVFFSPNGDKILTFCPDDGTVRIWEISQNSYKTLTGHKDGIKALFSPDGKTILTIGKDNTARLWDSNGNNLRVLKISSLSAAFSPDGKTILTGLFGAVIIDLEGNVKQTFKGELSQVTTSTAYSPDSKTILIGRIDGTLKLCDLNGNTPKIFNGHTKGIVSVAFSPDGKTVLTGSMDNTARLWNLNGNTLQIFTGHSQGINSAVFSPDGKLILTGSDDNTARLWDLKGNIMQIFNGHTGGVNSVAFSPDGKSIITGSEDKTARIWDLEGNIIQVLTGYKNSVYSAVFSPDGKSVLTGSGDNTGRIINIKPSLNLFLKEGFSEELNIQQKLQYGIIQIDQLNNEKDIKRIFDGLNYCLSESKLKKEKKAGYLNEASIFLRKVESGINTPENRKSFISYGLDLYKSQPQKYISDQIEKANQLFLSSTSEEELKEAFDFYSDKCNDLDSAEIIMKLPEYLVQISRKLLSADTSARHIISISLSDLSWKLLLNKKFNTSLEALKLALKADSTNLHVYITLPSALVLNDRFDEASIMYMKYKTKSWGKSFKQIYLDDIIELESHGIVHPDFAKVKELLKK